MFKKYGDAQPINIVSNPQELVKETEDETNKKLIEAQERAEKSKQMEK